MLKLSQFWVLLTACITGMATPLLALKDHLRRQGSNTSWNFRPKQLQMEAMFAGSSMIQYIRGT